MHQENPCTTGWGRPNLVRNAKEKMLEAILKDGMTKQAENQTPKLGRAQDLN
jgi:hypothetical protein